jgi:hypothetical protein
VQIDEQSLRTDLASARFLAGEDRGRWQFRELRWPHVFIDVTAKDGRAFTLRLDCSSYPDGAPTGTFWDLASDHQLPFDKWPRGGERIRLALRQDWKGGAALYLPCDRESFAGHDGWRTQYPQLLWNPQRGIVMYIEVVHDLLSSRDYECAYA